MTEGIAVMMRTITHRDPDQPFAAYLSNSYYYQLGPLAKEVLTVRIAYFETHKTKTDAIVFSNKDQLVELQHVRYLDEHHEQSLR